MITFFKAHGKPFSRKILIIVAETRKSFDPSEAVCGRCGRKGGLVIRWVYKRWLETLEDGKRVSVELVLFRCVCVCGKTHVVAPGELVIPFARYSLGFILAVLEAYAKREKPVRQIAEDFQIAVSTLYAWRDRFNRHCELLLGKLAQASVGIVGALEAVLGQPDLPGRLFIFVGTYGMCFLQAKERYHASRRFTLRGCLAPYEGASP